MDVKARADVSGEVRYGLDRRRRAGGRPANRGSRACWHACDRATRGAVQDVIVHGSSGGGATQRTAGPSPASACGTASTTATATFRARRRTGCALSASFQLFQSTLPQLFPKILN